jgi:hypothetical protein
MDPRSSEQVDVVGVGDADTDDSAKEARIRRKQLLGIETGEIKLDSIKTGLRAMWLVDNYITKNKSCRW